MFLYKLSESFLNSPFLCLNRVEMNALGISLFRVVIPNVILSLYSLAVRLFFWTYDLSWMDSSYAFSLLP